MADILEVLFFLFMAIQIVYHWMVFVKLAFHNQKLHKGLSPSVSVIIAARNEAENLPKLLSALKNQVYDDFEVIIVNDRSSDSTKQLLEQWGHFSALRTIHIEDLPESWTGKKYAIYRGVSVAKNELLLFTDGDCLPTSEYWIEEMASQVGDKIDIVLGYSPYAKRDGSLNKLIQFETLLVAIQYLSFALSGQPYMGVGRNMVIRRDEYDSDALVEMKSLVSGDDDLMVNRIANSSNIKININSNAQTVSEAPKTWKSYLTQKTRHLSVGTRYRKKHQTMLGLFSLSVLFGWILFFLLLVKSQNSYFILILFALRSLSFYTIFTRVGQKLEAKQSIWALPLLDLCYSFFYPLVGIRAWSTKNVQWK